MKQRYSVYGMLNILLFVNIATVASDQAVKAVSNMERQEESKESALSLHERLGDIIVGLFFCPPGIEARIATYDSVIAEAGYSDFLKDKTCYRMCEALVQGYIPPSWKAASMTQPYAHIIQPSTWRKKYKHQDYYNTIKLMLWMSGQQNDPTQRAQAVRYKGLDSMINHILDPLSFAEKTVQIEGKDEVLVIRSNDNKDNPHVIEYGYPDDRYKRNKNWYIDCLTELTLTLSKEEYKACIGRAYGRVHASYEEKLRNKSDELYSLMATQILPLCKNDQREAISDLDCRLDAATKLNKERATLSRQVTEFIPQMQENLQSVIRKD